MPHRVKGKCQAAQGRDDSGVCNRAAIGIWVDVPSLPKIIGTKYAEVDIGFGLKNRIVVSNAPSIRRARVFLCKYHKPSVTGFRNGA
jgi:hypothetical protein